MKQAHNQPKGHFGITQDFTAKPMKVLDLGSINKFVNLKKFSSERPN